VASSPEEGRSRHAGRIVDPLVREDGQTEPEVELGAEPTSAPASEAPGTREEFEAESGDANAQETSADTPLLRGRALRDRLIARAEGAKRSRVDPVPGFEEVGRAPAELDAASVRAPSAPAGRRRAQLSPTMVALFGTLVGLATVAALIALAIHLEPTPAQNQAAAPGEAVEAAEPEAPAVPKRQRARIPGPWRIADAKNDSRLRVIEGSVRGAPFLRAVQDAGVPKKEAYRILTAFKGLRDFDKPNRSDVFIALLDRSSSRLKAFEYVVGKEEIYQAKEGADGLLAAQRLDLKVERAQVKGALVVDGSNVDQAAEKGGFEPGLAAALDKAVDGHLSLQELERGDMLRVIAQEVTVLGEFARYSGIEALEWRPAKGKPLRLYYFRGPSSRGYFDDRGRSPYEGGWRKPIPTAPITSKFNMKRLHPVLKKVMPHTGTDFGAPSGTPVGASSYGTVSFVGYAGPSGNLVKVEHPGDIETGYAHLSRFAEGIKVGDRVKRLQVVGYVGSTGRSTGPHLHFTVKKNGEFIDPESLNLDGMRVLPKEERDLFAQTKAKYDRLLDEIALPAPLPVLEPVAAASPDTVSEPAEPDLDPESDEAAAEPAAAPAPPVPSPAPAPKPASPAPAPKATGNPVYLTDKELLEMQSGGDDGEVSE
jgi:murein DD-endopeptidase MepM/ murein hydrolase activator NlpD